MLAKDGYVALKWEAVFIELHVKNLLYSRILEDEEEVMRDAEISP